MAEQNLHIGQLQRDRELIEGRLDRAAELALAITTALVEAYPLSKVVVELKTVVLELFEMSVKASEAQATNMERMANALVQIDQRVEKLIGRMDQAIEKSSGIRDETGRLKELQGQMATVVNSGFDIVARHRQAMQSIKLMTDALQAAAPSASPLARKARIEAMLNVNRGTT